MYLILKSNLLFWGIKLPGGLIYFKHIFEGGLNRHEGGGGGFNLEKKDGICSS